MSYIGLILLIVFSVVDPGGGGGSPLFLDQTEAQRAEKTFSDTRLPLLSECG